MIRRLGLFKTSNFAFEYEIILDSPRHAVVMWFWLIMIADVFPKSDLHIALICIPLYGYYQLSFGYSSILFQDMLFCKLKSSPVERKISKLSNFGMFLLCQSHVRKGIDLELHTYFNILQFIECNLPCTKSQKSNGK